MQLSNDNYNDYYNDIKTKQKKKQKNYLFKNNQIKQNNFNNLQSVLLAQKSSPNLFELNNIKVKNFLLNKKN